MMIFNNRQVRIELVITLSEKRKIKGNLIIYDANGKYIDNITLSKKDICRGKMKLDDLFDYQFRLSRDDLEEIAEKIEQEFSKADFEVCQKENDNFLIEELLSALKQYILQEGIQKEEASKIADVMFDKTYGYLTTKGMQEFIKSDSRIGFKELEVYQILKFNKMLSIGKGRAFDCSVKVNGMTGHVKKIDLSKIQVIEEKEDSENE